MGTRSQKKSGGRKTKRVRPEDRRAALEAFRTSGLSQVMFAKQWGVNPTTFSGWVGRYAREGAKGLEPGAGIAKDRRGRKPWLAEPVRQAVAATKRRFPTFGLQKIKDSLRRFLGLKVSTGSVRKVLAAEGLPTMPVVRRRKRRKSPGPPHPFERARPNQLWQSDITYVDVPWSRRPLYLVAFLDDRKRDLEQQLLLRGSRDFESQAAYRAWLGEALRRRNAGRGERLAAERAQLRPLPLRRLPSYRELDCRVGQGSTIRAMGHAYSVPSRLKGERVRVRVHEMRVEVLFADRLELDVERGRGKNGATINYRHVISSLVTGESYRGDAAKRRSRAAADTTEAT